MKSITYYTSMAYIWQGKNSILFCGGLYNEKFTCREPNEEGLRATFNSEGAMEKSRLGFPVECETPCWLLLYKTLLHKNIVTEPVEPLLIEIYIHTLE